MAAPVKDDSRSAPVAEYMKIRQYVVNLAERAGDAQAMLPPMNELARRFGVTRMTVHKALRDLIRDQFLITRQGIGTFINPAKLNRREVCRDAPCLGLIVGDGKHCFYDVFYWSYLSALGQAATTRGYRVKPLNLVATTPKAMAKEVKDSFVDALAWLDCRNKLPVSVLRLLKSEGFPAVAVHSRVDGVSHVGMDGAAHGFAVGRALLAEGRRNAVFAVADESPFLRSELAGLRRAFTEVGETFAEGFILRDFIRVREDLEDVLDSGVKVPAIFSAGPYLPEIMAALRKHEVDIRDQCRLVAEPFFLERVPEFQGWVREYRFAELGELAVDMLERQLAGNCDVESKLLEFRVRTERMDHEKTVDLHLN